MRRSLSACLLGCAFGAAMAQTSSSNAAPPTPAQLPAVITASGAANAAAPPFSLREVLDMAHRLNPTLLASEQHVSAVHAQEITAGLRQNPVAVIGAQMLTLGPDDPNGPNFYQGGVQRLLERGNKRRFRLENARSTTAVSGFQLDDQRRQTDFAVRQAFSRMLYAQAALGISRDNLESYRKTVALMQVRLDAGDVDRTDFDRVELQLAGFENDYDNAQLTLRQGSIALQTLLGIATPADAFAITGSLEMPPVTSTLDELRAAALANRSDLKAGQAQVEANQAAIKLAQANGTADPTVEVEYERSGHANTAGGSINLPLRLFDRNQGEKERTRYELESSRLLLTAARNQVLLDVDTAWSGYLAAQSQSARYRSKYLAEAAHVRDNLEFSYRNGNATLLDYLSALADYRQVNLASLNANLQLLLAMEQLSFATQMDRIP